MSRSTVRSWLVAVVVFAVILMTASSILRGQVVASGSTASSLAQGGGLQSDQHENQRNRFTARPGHFPPDVATQSPRGEGEGPTSGGAVSATSAALVVSSPYYSLSEDVMPPAFREHLDYIVKKVNTRWSKSAWKKYDKVDITDCATQTPECTLFQHVASTAAEGEKPFRKCCVEHAKLKATMKWVAEKLDAHNVTYFLSTGSALGSFRHGGTIIPWDTDVDVAVYPHDAKKVEEIFSGNGVHHFHTDPLMKPMYWVHDSADGKPADGPHIEIFHDPVYTSYPESLLPLQRCPFYDTSLWCPKKAMLDVWFPSGWQRYGGCHYHGKGRSTMYSKGKRKMTDKC